MDWRIYRNATFFGASILMFLFFMIFVTGNFLQTILLQRTLAFTPLQAGYALLPGALAVAADLPICRPCRRPGRPAVDSARSAVPPGPVDLRLHLSPPGLAAQLGHGTHGAALY